MRARWLVPLCLVALFGCDMDSATTPLAPQFAKGGGGGGGPPSAPSVTSTIADNDASIAQTLQIRSDSLGAYTSTNTLSEIGDDWLVDALTPRDATRRVSLDFSQPISGTGLGNGAPIVVPFRMISKCSQDGLSFLALAPGATVSCPLHIRFDYAGGDYAVEMNPNPGYAPGTDNASVTCVDPASGAGPCTGWTITPSGTWSGGQANVAELIHYVTSKGKTTKTNEGHFYVSFKIDITSP